MKVIIKHAPFPTPKPAPPLTRHQCTGCGSVCEVEHDDWKRWAVPTPTPIYYWRCPVCNRRVFDSVAIQTPARRKEEA